MEEDFEEDNEIKELVDRFVNMVDSSQSSYFDSDDMIIIIDDFLSRFDFEHANDAIDYAVNLYPNDSSFRIQRVKKLIMELEFEAAELELDEIEASFPPTAEFYMEKVLLSKMKGVETNSLSLLQKAYKLEPDDPEIHFLLAFEYMKKKEVGKAVQHTIFAIKEDENFDERLYTISYLCEENNQYEDCVKFFTAISDAFPLIKGGWFGLGLAYGWLCDFPNAISAYKCVLSLDENTSTAYFNIGNAYYEMKDYDQAIQYYQLSFDTDEEDYNALSSIGDCYSIQNMFDKALEYYHKALLLNPIHTESNIGIVHILMLQNRKDEAALFIDKIFSNNTQSFELLFSVIDFFDVDEQNEKINSLFNLTLKQIENKTDFFRFFTDYCCENELYGLGITILSEHLNDEEVGDTIPYYLSALYYLDGNINEGNDFLNNALLINYDAHDEAFLSLDPLLESFSEIQRLIELYKK